MTEAFMDDLRDLLDLPASATKADILATIDSIQEENVSLLDEVERLESRVDRLEEAIDDIADLATYD